jgi:alpha-glucosidase
VPLYTRNLPEVHDVLRHWHEVGDEYDPPRIFLCETLVMDVRELADYVRPGELDLALNFPFFFSPFEPEALAAQVEAAESAFSAAGGWPVWCGSNHDFPRFPTRWADGDDDLARCALVMLLTLRGTAVLYQGDEIGMQDVPLPPGRYRDPFGPGERDPSRTPMRWTAGEGAGFGPPDVEPWLPLGSGPDVDSQRADPRSVLQLCRAAIALRARLAVGPYAARRSPPGTWVYERGQALVALNFGATAASIADVDGVIRLSTRLDRDGERVAGTLELGPRQAVVLLGP